jgi:hypothetical protein
MGLYYRAVRVWNVTFAKALLFGLRDNRQEINKKERGVPPQINAALLKRPPVLKRPEILTRFPHQ